ncbi:MAG: Rnf-Nqr domain containing protein [Pseudohongiellaceae bacterium]
MTNTLTIIIAAALVNNLILIQLLGVSSLFYATKRLPQAIEFGLFNFAVLFLTALLNSALYHYVLLPLNLTFLRLTVFVTVSGLIATALLQILKNHFPLTARQQGLLILLSGGNSAVLGTTVLNTSSAYNLSENIAYGFGAALGYSLVIIGFSALRTRLESADIPAPFRGNAIQLITAGLVAISLLGFAGLTLPN